MANRIKDALSPELYEYYKNHRSKYERFASDLVLLQAKLFKGMVDDKAFHVTKKKYGWEYECDCVTWLNDVTLKINTFSDFRKLYKNRLKKYQFKSPEYYAECEKNVAENDVEYVRSAMRAQSMRIDVARNYSAPMPQKDNCNDCVVGEGKENKAKEQDKAKENEIKKANGKMTDKDKDDCWMIMFGFFISFFFLGIIAYVLKHLLFAAWVFITFIGYCLINAAYAFLGIIFNFDTGSGTDWSTDIIGTPLGVWKAGGFIYGAIVVIIVFRCLYELIKNKCKK